MKLFRPLLQLAARLRSCLCWHDWRRLETYRETDWRPTFARLEGWVPPCAVYERSVVAKCRCRKCGRVAVRELVARKFRPT